MTTSLLKAIYEANMSIHIITILHGSQFRRANFEKR